MGKKEQKKTEKLRKSNKKKYDICFKDKCFIKLKSFILVWRSVVLTFMAVLGLISLTIILLTTNFTEIIDFFRNTTLLLVIIFIAIQILLMIVLTWRWALVLKAQGHKRINLFRLNKYRIAGKAMSFFTPIAMVGGEGIKTKIMARRESLSYTKALSTVVLDKSVDLTTSGFFFLIGSIIVIISINAEQYTKLILSILVLFLLIALILFNYRLFKGKSIIHIIAKKIGLLKLKQMKKIEMEFQKFDDYLHAFYKQDKKYFFYSILLSFISWVLMFLEYYVAGRMLGLNLSIWMIFLIVTLVGLAYIIPVPMALGTLEAGQLSAFSILGLSAAAGIGLSFIIRAKDMLLAFWGVGIMSFYGFDINSSLDKKGIGDEYDFKK